MLDVGRKEIKNLLVIVIFQYSFIECLIELKVQIQKIFWPIILIHTNILESQIYINVAFCQILSQLNELSTETFNEFLVDIRYPSLHANGNILI